MRIKALPNVLFVEFPDNSTVKCCIFTQPKYPTEDCTKYSPNVVYCGSRATLDVLRTFAKLSMRNMCVLTQRKRNLKCKELTPFGIRAIPTGRIGADPVVYLIEIGESIHMYTGQFVDLSKLLLSSAILERITDIYVDNTVAGLRQPYLLQQACSQIEQIVSAHKGYRIFLHMEMFGYEDLLYELARRKIKIALLESQQILFKSAGHADVFQQDGSTQIEIWGRFKVSKVFTTQDYEDAFKCKRVHIELIVCQHEFRQQEKVKGLFMVPYTPHPNASKLNNLFEMIRPQRVHPLVQPMPADDQLSTIPLDLLNDDCKLVYDIDILEEEEGDNESCRDQIFDTSEEVSGELSEEASDVDYDLFYKDSSENLVNDEHQDSPNSVQVVENVIEIIEIDDDGELYLFGVGIDGNLVSAAEIPVGLCGDNESRRDQIFDTSEEVSGELSEEVSDVDHDLLDKDSEEVSGELSEEVSDVDYDLLDKDSSSENLVNDEHQDSPNSNNYQANGPSSAAKSPNDREHTQNRDRSPAKDVQSTPNANAGLVKPPRNPN